METQITQILDEVVSKAGVYGCLLADTQGLCLGAAGKASIDSSGIIAAIAEHASKIEPNNTDSPIISYENDKRMCIIKKSEGITTAIFKSSTN